MEAYAGLEFCSGSNEVFTNSQVNDLLFYGFEGTNKIHFGFSNSNPKCSTLLISGDKVGVNNSIDPTYNLHVNGSIYASTYCNLLINSATSSSTSNSPTCSALNNVYNTTEWNSNQIVTTSNFLYSTHLSNSSSWNSSSGNVFIFTSNVGINTSNPILTLTVNGSLLVTSNASILGNSYQLSNTYMYGECTISNNVRVTSNLIVRDVNYVYGREVSFIESLDDSSNSTSNYLSKTILTTVCEGGNYMLQMNYVVMCSLSNNLANIRVLHNSNNTVHNAQLNVFGDSNEQWVSDVRYLTLPAGNHVFDLQFRNDLSNVMLVIRKSKLCLTRIS